MAEEKIPIHYVCTHTEAKELIEKHNQFWITNCGCRESNEKGCQRSRIDVCLSWDPHDPGSGSNKKVVDQLFVDGIMEEAQKKHLVTRPFRNEARTDTAGICFCCDDCCAYFVSPGKYACDKGKYIEKTNMSQCTHCGACESVCYFQARKMINDKLEVDRDFCYGCGLCVAVCPIECIVMILR